MRHLCPMTLDRISSIASFEVDDEAVDTSEAVRLASNFTHASPLKEGRVLGAQSCSHTTLKALPIQQ